MANGHGGARPGAGRRPRPKQHEQAIEAAEAQIVEALPNVIGALLELSLGITVQEVDEKTGAINVYTRPPDGKAGMYLVDRILGKPTQRAEVDVEVEGLDVNEQAQRAAEQQLALWRRQMTEQLNMLNAPQMLHTAAILSE